MPAPALPAPPAPALRRVFPLLPAALWTVVVLAGFLLTHNFCLNLLPRVALPLDPTTIRAESGGHAFSVPFQHSPPDTSLNPRSRVTFTEDGRPLIMKLRLPAYVFGDGSGAWSHVPGRIIFSTPDHTDPRTNGRRYVAHSPLLYSRTVAYSALAAFIAALLALRRLTPSESLPALAPADASPRFTLHVTAAALVFLAGLYFATGTLAPYANTLLTPPDPATGYLYNGDHAFHRTLFAFVDGEPRAAWQDSILLRRVLYAVLAWPWMHTLGFELGGIVFNLGANFLGFLAGVAMVRRHVGLRGATLGAWLFALYPGAAYWVGHPYAYALIFPLGIAAFWILLELPSARPVRLALLSLALGTIYLSYDFHVYFLPASLLLLVWQRRFAATAASAFLQILPLGTWLAAMKYVVKVPLENGNTGIYREVVVAFFTPRPPAEIMVRLTALPETAAELFLGANFLFLPLLAAFVWALDFSWRNFTRHRAVPALLAAGAALFVFCNYPPPLPTVWNLSGSWIARLYQPLFPALVFSLAWWWQERLPQAPFARGCRVALVGVTLAANTLVCFGPVTGLRVPLAETAFYRFYNHTDLHWAYERNLRIYGRRPLGFPLPAAQQIAPPGTR